MITTMITITIITITAIIKFINAICVVLPEDVMIGDKRRRRGGRRRFHVISRWGGEELWAPSCLKNIDISSDDDGVITWKSDRYIYLYVMMSQDKSVQQTEVLNDEDGDDYEKLRHDGSDEKH